MLSEVFYSFFITSVIGFLVVIARMMYKSKCREFSFCCFKIVRDVNLEAEIDEEMIGNGINPADSSKDLKGKTKAPLPISPMLRHKDEEVKDIV